MEIRVLGSVELWNGEQISVGGPRQRRILAAPAMDAGSVVSLDARRFEDACAGASRPQERGDLEGSLAHVDEALAHWAGRPYAEFADEHWAQAEVARLEALRAVALELRADAMVRLGRGVDALPALESLIEEHPLRERPRALYMHR